jgi:hypothetical protein
MEMLLKELPYLIGEVALNGVGSLKKRCNRLKISHGEAYTYLIRTWVQKPARNF